MDKESSTNNLNKEECFFCKDIVITLIPFSCLHQICPRCIIQRIFCYQIVELNYVNQIQMKCKCTTKGNLSLTLQQLNDLFGDYARTTDLQTLKCRDHDVAKDYYCKECNHLICQRCIDSESKGHSNHRFELKSSLAKKIRSLIPNMSMSLLPREVFDTKYEETIAQFEKEVTENFKGTMRNIESLIKSLQNLQETYSNNYKKAIEKGVYNLKLVKLFYYQFFADLKEFENSEDINALRYLNNIGYMFKNIKINHDQKIDQKVTDIKLKVEEMKRENEHLHIEFYYDEVPRSYRCTNIISKAHPDLIKSVIQLKDETIITGGNDSCIKLWKDNGVEYTNTAYINKLVGKKINALLEIIDNRIISSTEGEGNIKIWKQNNNSYTVQQSLSHHQHNVTSLAKFPDGKLVSGSEDKTAVVFKEVSEDCFEIIWTFDQINEPIFGLLPIDEQRLVIQTANKLHCYKDSENGFVFDKVFEIGLFTNQKIKTMCLLQKDKIAFGGSTKKIVIINQDDFTLKQILDKHEGHINAVIQLRNGYLASASQDHSIIIWKLDDATNEYQLHSKIADYSHGLYSLIELQDSQLCSSCSHNKLIFWRCRNDLY